MYSRSSAKCGWSLRSELLSRADKTLLGTIACVEGDAQGGSRSKSAVVIRCLLATLRARRTIRLFDKGRTDQCIRLLASRSCEELVHAPNGVELQKFVTRLKSLVRIVFGSRTCLCESFALGTMLRELGLPAEVVIASGHFQMSVSPFHAWVAAGLPARQIGQRRRRIRALRIPCRIRDGSGGSRSPT